MEIDAVIQDERAVNLISAQVWGEHFKLDDCRVWMRLHFWAAREVGLFADHPAFMDYYVRFIGHFVSVYERLAPPFARESARWSESPANVEAYLVTKQMPDVVGASPRPRVKIKHRAGCTHRNIIN